MTTNRRHVRIDLNDDDLAFASDMDAESELPDPPESQTGDHDDTQQQEQRGYRT